MRKHGGTPSRRDKYVTLAAISPPGVARGRFVGGQQSGLAGSKPPPLFTREASSCSSQGRRQGEPWGAFSTTECTYPTYLPVSAFLIIRASGCSNVRQLDNSFQKVVERMISAMTSALVLSVVAYDHLVLDQSSVTTEL